MWVLLGLRDHLSFVLYFQEKFVTVLKPMVFEKQINQIKSREVRGLLQTCRVAVGVEMTLQRVEVKCISTLPLINLLREWK